MKIEKLLKKINDQSNIEDLSELIKKQQVSKKWFKVLRDEILLKFSDLENEFSCTNKIIKNSNIDHQFVKKNWNRKGGGGGTISILKADLFEKVGVNISTVFGVLSKNFRNQIPGAEKNGKFWASGISLVSHMYNPKIPAAHMNTRLLITGEGKKQKVWFGGGCDLTPMIKDKDAEFFFHQELKKMCSNHNRKYYNEFKIWCDNYFYLPHRNEKRGVGGIFFDYLNTGNFEKDFSFVKDVGKTFVNTYCEIIKDRMYLKHSNTEKNIQLEKRGRYVEFNLLYDRGTIFGLKTNGNVDAILMSLPPLVKWK